MTAKQMTDIAESLEKLGYEIIKIKEKKEDPDFPHFPAITQIIITPVKTNAEKHDKPNAFLESFKDQINK
ncbi:hypothetical protein R84B8_01813 [Treponema sp. R8-4-B8]